MGFWAVDAEPIARSEAGEPVGSLACPLLNADDLLELERHRDPRRSSGCCGRDGLDGPNLVCPRCLTEVATIRDDCWSYVEVRLEPAAVRQRNAQPAG
jgi:hypothetical protein